MKSHRSNRRARRMNPGLVELLEDRRLLATFTVVTPADSGAGSLRQAILDANALEGADIINFQITGPNLVISPATALPNITDALEIDGSTQTGFPGTPIIALDGTHLTAGNGLNLAATGIHLIELAVYNFPGHGVLISAPGNDVVTACYIGADASSAAAGNFIDGIHIDASSQNTIVANIITANRGRGISVVGNSSAGNHFIGNHIFANGNLGIDLGGDGPDNNDFYDSDLGPNGRVNFPVITSANQSETSIQIGYTYDGEPNGAVYIEFFASPTADPTGRGEGKQSLGTSTVPLDSIGHASGTANFTFSTQSGAYITATATDANANTSEFSAAVQAQGGIVAQPLVYTAPTDLSGYAKHISHFFLGTLQDSGGTLSAGNITATVQWGDGKSSGLAVTPNGTGYFQLSGDHTYATSGDFTATISITTTDQRTAGGQTIITITTPILDLNGNDGYDFALGQAIGTNQPLADLSDPVDLPLSKYNVTINWGDGTSSVGLVRSVVDRGNQVFGTHFYIHPGSYQIQVTVSDSTDSSQGRSASATSSAYVYGDEIPVTSANLVAFEGFAVRNVRLATFRDDAASGPGDFTTLVDWGDGAQSPGVLTQQTDGTFVLRGNHAYAKAGQYPITVRAVGPNPNQGTPKPRRRVNNNAVGLARATAFVLNAPRYPIAQKPQPKAKVAFNGLVFAFLDSNPLAVPSDYTATIDWGDDRSSAGVVRNTVGRRFDVAGRHTYAKAGTYTLTIELTDSAGESFTQSQKVIVK